MQITYQKENGYIFQRIRNTTLPYKIGDITSMGWKVLNIEYKYKDKFYSEYKYNLFIQQDKKASIKRNHNKELYMKEVKNFLYCFISILLMCILSKLLGI